MAAVVENLLRSEAVNCDNRTKPGTTLGWKAQSEYLTNDCLDRRASNSTFQKRPSVKVSRGSVVAFPMSKVGDQLPIRSLSLARVPRRVIPLAHSLLMIETAVHVVTIRHITPFFK